MAAPTITFREFTVGGTDPSGYRQYKTGDELVHASFSKSLGVGAAEHLDFGINNISNSGVYSSTKVVLAHDNFDYWQSHSTCFQIFICQFSKESFKHFF